MWLVISEHAGMSGKVFMLCEISVGCGIRISFGHWCADRVVGVSWVCRQ